MLITYTGPWAGFFVGGVIILGCFERKQKLDYRMLSKCEWYDYAGCLQSLYAKTPYLSFSLPIHDINLNIEVENDRFFACITER